MAIIFYKVIESTIELRKAVLCAGIVLAFVLHAKNLNAQDVYIINPYIQPNDTTLNWYASGDANGDDTLTIADLNLMQEYIDGTYTPDLEQDRRAIDRMDVNLDQTINSQDKNMLEEHVTNSDSKFYQPNWYFNKLKTRSVREEYLQKALDIDDADKVCEGFSVQECACSQYSTQAYLNFQGLSQKTLDWFKPSFEYVLENNGRFNLPLLKLFTTDYLNGEYFGGHAMNTIILGNKTLEWESLCNVEPQEGYENMNKNINIQPGEYYLDVGDSCFVSIGGPPSRYPPQIPLLNYYMDYMEYLIDDKIPELIYVFYQGYSYILREERDTINPEILTTLENGSVYEACPKTTINISDKYPVKAWFSFNDGQTKRKLVRGNKVISENLPQGQYEMIVYAGDEFWNEVLKRWNFTINDTIPPRITIISPLEYEVYGNSPEIKISIEEPNLNQARYSMDGGSTWTSFNRDTTFNSDLTLGDYRLSVKAEDNIGNIAVDSVFFIIADLQAPTQPTGLMAINITTSSFDLIWDSATDNVGVSGYHIYLGDDLYATTDTNLFTFVDLTPNTLYKVNVTAFDAAGNESNRFPFPLEVRTLDEQTGLGSNSEQQKRVIIYPNPTNDFITVEIGNFGPYYINISGLNGQILYDQQITESKYSIDLSHFKKGIYFITIRSEEFVKTEKIIKF